MNIEFATCSKITALEYIKEVYPNDDVTELMVSKLLDLVEKDIVRIRDPFMYGKRIAVISGKNYDSSYTQQIDEAIEQMKNNNLL